MRTLVIDNGSYELKLGWADTQKCLHVQNAMMRSRDRRLWLGNAIDLCKDLTGLQYRRPVERGQLYSWELEKAIWDWTWDTKEIVDNVDEFRDSALLMTESPGSLPSSSGNTDQIVFEEYEFAKYRRAPAQVLAANAPSVASQAKLVIDLGFHATHVVPVLNNFNAVASGTRRLDVGGKMLTNYLKETVSYRYYNMMEETAILSKIKERACFVSTDYARDMAIWHKSHVAKKHSKFALSYALPSTHEDPLGHVVPDLDEALAAQKSGEEQILILENERFSIPESLFDPKGHLGLNQAPLPETVARCINASPEEYQPLLWSNIVLCGGTAKLPHLQERLESEIRKWAPDSVPVRIHTNTNNEHSETAWKGGVNLAQRGGPEYDEWVVSREEYLEQGPHYVARKFASTNAWRPPKIK